MSGGTGAGNIVTDAAATYAARTWVDVTKNNAYGVVSDAQLANIVGANWFNNVDDTLIALNAWFNGTGEAPHIRAATATIGSLSFGDVVAETLIVGTGALADAATTADDVVVGDIEAVDHGVTILTGTANTGRLAFTDTAGAIAGGLQYEHTSDTLTLLVAGAAETTLTSAAFAPATDDGLTLGDATHAWATIYGTAAVLATATLDDGSDTIGLNNTAGVIDLGSGVGSPALKIDRDGAGTGSVDFETDSTMRWRLIARADGNLALARHDGSGVLVDAVTYDATTGEVAFPEAVSVADTLTVSGATVDFDHADAAVTLGDGTGTPTLVLDGSVVRLTLKASGTTAFDIGYDGDFAITRYSGGVAQDSILFEQSTGTVYMPSTLRVGNATNGGSLVIAKDELFTAGLSFESETVQRWSWTIDASEDLGLRRYDSGGSLQDTMTVSNSTGKWTFPGAITVSAQTGNQFTAGSGVPSGGTNGDLYWRVNGTASTCLYYRVGGVWTALAT